MLTIERPARGYCQASCPIYDMLAWFKRKRNSNDAKIKPIEQLANLLREHGTNMCLPISRNATLVENLYIENL